MGRKRGSCLKRLEGNERKTKKVLNIFLIYVIKYNIYKKNDKEKRYVYEGKAEQL